MAAWLLKRLAGAVGVMFLAVVLTSAVLRGALPSHDRTRAFLPGVAHDVDRMLLHFDFGRATTMPGQPPVHDIFAANWGPDVSLVVGGLLIGLVAGTWAGAFCAARTGTWPVRVIEFFAAFWLCAPVYVVAFALLLLFEPTFGVVRAPLFFEPGRYGTLLDHPWGWLQSMLVPWLIVAAPIGAVVSRLTAAGARDELDEEYIRTAVAKGLGWGRVVGRHAVRSTRPTLAGFLGVHTRQIVLNVILVENVFFVPGFLVFTQRATNDHDFELLQGLAVWSAALTITLTVLSDIVVRYADPRSRNWA